MVLACPGARQGEILLNYPREHLHTSTPGHTNNITGIAINYDGSRIATASEKGTLIRIFDTRKLHEPWKTLRRGTNPANIQSLVLNSAGTELAAASDTGTVHLFSCEEGENNYNSFSYLSYFGSNGETSGHRFYLQESAPTVSFSKEKGTLFVVGSTLGYWKCTYGKDGLNTETSIMPATTFVA